MNLFLPALVSGVTAGALYGLLAFSVVVLYKATGVANFAVGIIGTLGTFIVWRLGLAGVSLPLAVAVGIASIALIGAVIYFLVIRPRASASGSNMVVRTLALSFTLTALVDHFWAVGQPFAFPTLLPEGGITFGALELPWATIVILTVALGLVGLFAYVFNRTNLGLQMKAVAADREIAKLLGVRYRTIACIVWAISGVLTVTVALLSANRLLLTTHMLEGSLLYSFAGAIIFGLTSLSGAIIGSLAIGVLNSIVSTYASSEIALIAVFGVLLITMFVKPDGIFGHREARRV